MSWIQHGEIEEDGGQFGGNAQIGASASIRMINPDLPGRVVDVHVYPAARELRLDEQPDCTHIPGEAHLRCSYNMDAVGLEMLTICTTCTDIEDPGSTEKWSDLKYDAVDSGPFTGTDEEIVAKAEAAALAKVRSFVPERDIDWDGEPF